ncbi:MAG: hypothetical protein S4CHLAM20_06990 [Chlamydiia bacterium]|nr:hypothetical protein [Chlamydiia bacterium]
MSVIIAMSGCSGGNQGPLGVYPKLKKIFNDESFKLKNLQTVANDYQKNILKVERLALKQFAKGKKVLLCGYSMSASVMIIAAHKLIQSGKVISGIILINPEAEKLRGLAPLKVPVLSFHGEKDTVFPLKNNARSFTEIKARFEAHVFKDLDHDLKPGDSKQVAAEMKNKIEKFFT